MNSNDLMGLFRAGDPQAFSDIYKMFYSRVSFFAKGITGNEEEGKDIAIDSFLQLWKRHNNFETLQNVKAFLFISARNACIDFLKQNKRKQDSLRNLAGFSDNWEPAHLHILIRSEIFRQIADEVETLPFDCRRVFKMVYYDGKKPAEIAAELNIDVRTVASHKSNALRCLRKKGLPNRLFIIFFALFWLISLFRKLF